MKKKVIAKAKSAMPVPRLPRELKRSEEALRRLRIKPEQLSVVPQITATYRNAIGGLKAVLAAMRFCSDDDVIAKFLRRYDAIPEGDRKLVPWEAVALAAGLDVRTVSGAIMDSISRTTATTSKIIAVTGHPELMRARIKYGQLPSGERDRTAVDLMVGAQPSPKGPTFIGRAVFNAGGNINSSLEGDDEDEKKLAAPNEDEILDQLFPSPVKVQEKLIPIRNRLLPAGGQ